MKKKINKNGNPVEQELNITEEAGSTAEITAEDIPEKKVSEGVILYDPMFAKKPVQGFEDSEKGGIFGKAVTKKIIFIIALVIAIGASIFFSFNALNKDKYSYKEVDGSIQLSEFNGTDDDTVLDCEYFHNEDDTVDETKTVTSVRNYAVSCNETLRFVYIGKDVTELEYNCFYYCKNMLAVIVDPENANYTSVDGVLYSKDMTEIIIHPIKNNEYRTAIANGMTEPATIGECEAFVTAFDEKYPMDDEGNRAEAIEAEIEKYGSTYEIAETVTKIAPFCFNYCDKLTQITIPDGVTELGEMAFFKCTALESIYLPDGLVTIGADAVSYCELLTYIYVPASVTEIGHHAFYDDLGCDTIYMGAADKSQVKTGESWLPKTGERSLKNVEVLYGQTRRTDNNG